MRVGPGSHGWGSYKGHRHTGEMAAETGVMQPQDRECLGWPEATRVKEGFPQDLWLLDFGLAPPGS